MKKKLFIVFLSTIFLSSTLFFVYSHRQKRNKVFSPCLKNNKKRTIAYLQSGHSKAYASSLKNIIDQLAEKGWLEPLNWSLLSEDSSAKEIWEFVSKNMQSKYLTIKPEYFWDFQWNESQRRIIRKKVLSVLGSKKIDLMLAVGTWAVLDMANNSHSVPTICLESSFPIKKLFKKEEKVPVNLYLSKDPECILRQIRLFRKITKFETLGVVYVASSEGRSKASLELLRQVSKDKGFKLVVVRILPSKELNSEEMLNSYIKAYRDIAPNIDAMWLSSDFFNQPKAASRILAPMFAYKIPTWYPHGEQAVANGAVFGVVHDPEEEAMHYAEVIADILNSGSVFKDSNDMPVSSRFLINYAAAKKTGLNISKTLLAAAKKSYLTINTGENQ